MCLVLAVILLYTLPEGSYNFLRYAHIANVDADAGTHHTNLDLNSAVASTVHSNLGSLVSYWSQLAETNGIFYTTHAGTALAMYRDGEIPPWDDDVDIFLRHSEFSRLRSTLESIAKRTTTLVDLKRGFVQGYTHKHYFFFEPKVDIFGYWFKMIDLEYRHGVAGSPLAEMDIIDCSTPETLWCDSAGFLDEGSTGQRENGQCRKFLSKTCPPKKYAVKCMVGQTKFYCQNNTILKYLSEYLYGDKWYMRPFCKLNGKWIKRKTDARGRKKKDFNCKK